MTPIAFIRQNVFGLSQSAFASLAETTQPTVSRWENRELAPDTNQCALIRKAALERGLDWDDRWFFELPAEVMQ